MLKYNKGFVLGVFDFFHIGHLNLIRRAKERCNYLLVGVVVDELPLVVKGSLPFVPFEERFGIVKAVRYVDEVIKVDFDNAHKKDIWLEHRFDCFFCGDDYGDNAGMLEEQKWFRERGSDIVFLPYTKGRTSTDLRRSLIK